MCIDMDTDIPNEDHRTIVCLVNNKFYDSFM